LYGGCLGLFFIVVLLFAGKSGKVKGKNGF
jgi:hypothetical protein